MTATTFDVWYSELAQLAAEAGGDARNIDAWYDRYLLGETPEAAWRNGVN